MKNNLKGTNVWENSYRGRNGFKKAVTKSSCSINLVSKADRRISWNICPFRKETKIMNG